MRKFRKIKRAIRKSAASIRKNGPIILSAMAAIAIVDYLSTHFGVANKQWYLLLLAGVTGVTAILLPFLGRKFKSVWAVIPTGLAILAIQVWPELLDDRRNIGTLIFGLSLVTEALVHGFDVFHVGEFLLDLATAFIAGWWIVVCYSEPFTAVNTVITLLVAFIITLMVNFQGKFSVKGTDHKETATAPESLQVESLDLGTDTHQ